MWMPSTSCKKEGESANTQPTIMKLAAPALAGPANARRISAGTWMARTRVPAVIARVRVSGIRNSAAASNAASTMSST